MNWGKSKPTVMLRTTAHYASYFLTLTLLGGLMSVSGCGNHTENAAPFTARILASHPHDSAAYTQGLLYRNGLLYESTGLYRESTVREIEPSTGNILRKLDLPPDVFGEGLAFHSGRFFILTWRKGTAFEIEPSTFAVLKKHEYEGEGWGLTSNGHHLIMSDGTSTLRFISPDDFSVTKTLRVTKDGKPVIKINELEYVDGEIYANIYTTDRIVVIDTQSGHVTAEYDLSELRTHLPTPNRAEVLNGIAYDPTSGHFHITGKRWPLLFEMELIRSTTH